MQRSLVLAHSCHHVAWCGVIASCALRLTEYQVMYTIQVTAFKWPADAYMWPLQPYLTTSNIHLCLTSKPAFFFEYRHYSRLLCDFLPGPHAACPVVQVHQLQCLQRSPPKVALPLSRHISIPDVEDHHNLITDEYNTYQIINNITINYK